MKELILNDGRKTEVQDVTQLENNLLIRLVLTTSEQLKAFFKDEFASQSITLRENNQDVAAFQNYTILNYIKEETGGIWEVSLSQTAPSTDEKIQEIEQGLQENVANLEKAVAELTMLISTMTIPPVTEEGEKENV